MRLEMLENLEKNLLKYRLVKIVFPHLTEKFKVVFAERGIYPYLKRIEPKGNTFNDGCKTGTDVMNKDYARLRSKSWDAKMFKSTVTVKKRAPTDII